MPVSYHNKWPWNTTVLDKVSFVVAKVSGSGYYKGVCRVREHVKHAIGSNKLEGVQVFYILILMVDMFMLLFYVEDMAWLHSIIRP